MVAFGMTMKQQQGGFFDRPGVLRIIDRGTAAGLSKFGAYVRQTAQQSIRSPGKKGKPSKPGKPPKNRSKIPMAVVSHRKEKAPLRGPVWLSSCGEKF